jgi:hypothetical protein
MTTMEVTVDRSTFPCFHGQHANDPTLDPSRSAVRAPTWSFALSGQLMRGRSGRVKDAVAAMREIPLTQGKVALVDDEDYEALNAFKWYAYRSCRTYYAQRMARRPDGGWNHEDMHRAILARKLERALVKGEKTDHWNGDGLDNQRGNLRLATNAQNNRNCRRRRSNPSSQYLGVSWDKCRKKWRAQWRAQMMVNGEPIFLGYHTTELAAAEAREAYVIAHPELMARLNFPGSALKAFSSTSKSGK